MDSSKRWTEWFTVSETSVGMWERSEFYAALRSKQAKRPTKARAQSQSPRFPNRCLEKKSRCRVVYKKCTARPQVFHSDVGVRLKLHVQQAVNGRVRCGCVRRERSIRGCRRHAGAAPRVPDRRVRARQLRRTGPLRGPSRLLHAVGPRAGGAAAAR